MCEPTAIMVASTALTVSGAVANHLAQDKASKQNKQMADEAAANDLGTLSVRDAQERTASLGNILGIERQVQQERASAAVMAGEAGISGASVTALLSLFETRGGEAVSDVNQQLSLTQDQLRREAQSVGVTRRSRIAAVPKGNPIETGLRVAGAGLDLVTGIKGNKPVKGGG